MIFTEVAEYWARSASVSDEANFRLRVGFLRDCLSCRDAVRKLLRANLNTSLGRLISERPETLGIVTWPYQNSKWGQAERIDRLIQHYSVAEEIGSPVDFGSTEKVLLVDMVDIVPDLRIILDQAKWFMREGGLVLNLFVGQRRVFSLAFSLYRESTSIGAVIGAMQGRDSPNVLDIYRNITKHCGHMRPRDFLLEVFRMLALRIGVSRILAISDAARHHRHSYFKDKHKVLFRANYTNYDEIWIDRGAQKISNEFFELPVVVERKPLADIPAKKRGQYRKRFELLEEVSRRLGCRLSELKGRPDFADLRGFEQ